MIYFLFCCMIFRQLELYTPTKHTLFFTTFSVMTIHNIYFNNVDMLFSLQIALDMKIRVCHKYMMCSCVLYTEHFAWSQFSNEHSIYYLLWGLDTRHSGCQSNTASKVPVLTSIWVCRALIGNLNSVSTTTSNHIFLMQILHGQV